MARNYRGTGTVVRIKSAAAAVTGGSPKVEGGFHGIVGVSAAAGEPYPLHIDGEYEVNAVASVVQGSTIYITDSSGALSLTSGSGKRIFGKCSAVYGAGSASTFGKEPASGKMWVRLAHQNDAA